jgi:atypical dual specificity phosphatase
MGTGIHRVPEVPIPAEMTKQSLEEMVQSLPSAYRNGLAEGVYLRRERGDILVDRAKIVRKDFKAGNKKWSRGGKRRMALNQLTDS